MRLEQEENFREREEIQLELVLEESSPVRELVENSPGPEQVGSSLER